MTKEISFRPAHFQSFHKGSENAVIESERLPGRVSFATIFLPKGGGDLFFTAAPPHEASFGRVCRKKYFVRSSPQRSRSLQTRRLRNIRPTAQRWMRGLRPICGPVSQRLISPAGRIRPAPGSCRARALFGLPGKSAAARPARRLAAGPASTVGLSDVCSLTVGSAEIGSSGARIVRSIFCGIHAQRKPHGGALP